MCQRSQAWLISDTFTKVLVSPSCLSGKGLVAEHPTPAHQCSHSHPKKETHNMCYFDVQTYKSLKESEDSKRTSKDKRNHLRTAQQYAPSLICFFPSSLVFGFWASWFLCTALLLNFIQYFMAGIMNAPAKGPFMTDDLKKTSHSQLCKGD